MAKTPLTSSEIEQQLHELLATVLSPRRTVSGAADTLARLDRAQQEFIIQSTRALAHTNAELGFLLVQHAAEAVALMPLSDVSDWLEHAVEQYDRKGLFAASRILEGARDYAGALRQRASAVQFDDVAGMLAIFVNGLAGRQLMLQPGEQVYSDTETLFLPGQVTRFDDPGLNRKLYKAMASYLWAQTWYGTFRPGPDGKLLHDRLADSDNPAKARDLFDAMEAIRINACVARDLPGLYRQWRQLQQHAGEVRYAAHWSDIVSRLQRPQASAETSWQCLTQAMQDDTPPAFLYQGQLMPEIAREVMTARLMRDKLALQSILADLAREQAKKLPVAAMEQTDSLPLFEIRAASDTDRSGQFDLQLSLGGQAMSIPHELDALLQAILQDLGGFPADYLVPAGNNDYAPRAMDAATDISTEEGLGPAVVYPEWDHQRRQYRKAWCYLREQPIEPDDEPFVQATLKKYHGELHHLRKAFEALRGEDRLLKRQPEGDDVDFDAVVQAMTDLSLGLEMPPQLFTQQHRHERNIAVMFMIDMSGSTRGWVNEAERESLVLLCQALEILGDRYAIYGFSGMTRKRCDLYRIKQFDEPYSKEVEQRISGIKAQDYTRMGVTIRHLSTLLNAVDARTKLLITLSDGKPDDFDGYRGKYGIEDTRQALIEAKRQGIHSFCITIDDEARDYLPHMYGAVNYTIIDDVRKLPLKVADIYRRLTV